MLGGERGPGHDDSGQTLVPVGRSLHVTVTQTGATGNLRLFPAGSPLPLVSPINYAIGQTRANNGIMQLNLAGELAVFVGQPAGTTTHLIIDVSGYFE